jgi:hypothetical protein
MIDVLLTHCLNKQHSDIVNSHIHSSLFTRIKCRTRLQQLSGQTKFSYKPPCSETLAYAEQKGLQAAKQEPIEMLPILPINVSI